MKKTPAPAPKVPARKAAAPAKAPAVRTKAAPPPPANAKAPASPAAPVVSTKPAAKPRAEAAVKSAPKDKLLRDGFTFPQAEYQRIADMKRRALALGADVKKSELVRAGLACMAALPDADFLKALAAVPKIKTGRKKKGKAA